MLLPFHDENPTRHTPWVTIALVAINTAVFLGVNRLPAQRQVVVSVRHGFVPARIEGLLRGQPVTVTIEEPVGRDPWDPRRVFVREKTFRLDPVPREVAASLVTCMFLHSGWAHLIGNMWFLWLFGNNVEDRLGPLVFLVFYLVGGLAATAAHWLCGPSSTVPVVGASGAIAAVLGAYAVTWPWARVRTLVFLIVFITVIDLPALAVLGFWFATQLLEGLQTINIGIGGGVAWWAHVGGFVAGMAMMPPLRSVIDRVRIRQQADVILAQLAEEDQSPPPPRDYGPWGPFR